MKRIIVLSLVILASCRSSMNLISSPSDLDDALHQIMDYKRLTGFSVSVFSKDSIFYQKAYGYSNWESKVPYTLETKQILASISKTTIATALMKGQELGLYHLDDPINEHLPFTVYNPYYPGNNITIRHLAMHTSSIKYSAIMTDSISYENADQSIEDFTRQYLVPGGLWYSDNNFHNNRPGMMGDYTNVGATLAAFIVEHASGLKFADFAAKYIFDPIEMKQTQYYDGNNSDAQYYEYVAQNEFQLVTARRDGMYPSGSQLSNIKDLTKFCQAMMNNDNYDSHSVLNKNSIREMLTAIPLKNSLDDEISRQGILWHTMKNPLGIPREMIGHNGGDTGIYTMMFFDMKTGLGYILLSNTGLKEENHISMVGIYKSLWNYSKSIKSH